MKTEREKLAAWCEELALYRIPDGETEALCPQDSPDFSEQPVPEEGQIRLWPAGEQDAAPLYGLLVHAGYDRWQVLPFSPLGEPAVPAEVRVREEPPVQILEGWNRRELSGAQVRRSWCVDRIPEKVWFWLRDWLILVEEGRDMPERFREQTGPALRHPLDPRHEWLDAEAARVDDCLGEPSATYGTSSESIAAEPDTPYGDEPEGE
jgi:hypothetical protein